MVLEDETSKTERGTYSSHLNDHRKETFPTSLSSTVIDGLKSSKVFCRLTGVGAVPEIRTDPDIGSRGAKGEHTADRTWGGGPTVDVDLIRSTLDPMLAIMYDSRGINEVNHVRVARAGGEL